MRHPHAVFDEVGELVESHLLTVPAASHMIHHVIVLGPETGFNGVKSPERGTEP